MTDELTERLSARAAAELIGVAKQTWWAWVKRDRAPAPDGYDAFSGMAYWHRGTVMSFDADRALWRERRRRELAGVGAK